MVTTHATAELEEVVLLGAGAVLPQRDQVDARIVDEVRQTGGSLGIGSDYPVLERGEPSVDGDRDGMADEWERGQGLDPENPLDGNGDVDGNGYTDVEDYLNELAGGYMLSSATLVREEEGRRAGALTLHRNYPNPFNLTTVIAYELAGASTVNLAIYDLTGQKVRSLISGSQEEGYRTVLWNGRDDGGRVVAAGSYFFRLEVDGAVRRRKMLLIK